MYKTRLQSDSFFHKPLIEAPKALKVFEVIGNLIVKLVIILL